ncbi:sodium:proton antiporter [bacterium DOLZORAL124_64_63]|nr:MAG: sodium:proton antiporter [bacterium DOLZORAL124_64_63]
MHHGFSHNPALTVALAMAAGVLAQTLARHLRIPGIVLLLAVGVILGPDVAGILDPEVLGSALDVLVGFSVAVILFDGGLNLHAKRMKSQAPAIRMLLTVGVVVTTAGGALAARAFLGWAWTPALLFGTLVIVTGPTVVTPLLRRIRVRKNIETILETEGVLIDAVGAVVAVVALEIALGQGFAEGAVSAPTRLALGLAVGAAGGLVMAMLLRVSWAVPDGFETIFTLSLALAIFQVSNAIIPESGIMAAIVAGVVVGNAGARSFKEIREFKEQLTVMLIGMLFILLAADVRVADVLALGKPGIYVVLALMFVVRPLNILACTLKSGLSWREKAFLSWVAPRGIVAAAVASLFAERLGHHGETIGTELRALVFLVIAATVVVQGATAGVMARLLKVRRPSGKGFAVFSADPFGRLIARLLGEHGHEVVIIDADATKCREAEKEGLKVVYGNALDENVLLRSQMDTRRAALGVTANEALNLLFARVALTDAQVPLVYAASVRPGPEIQRRQFTEAGARLLFGNETDPELWSVRIRRKLTEAETWIRESNHDGDGPKLPTEALSWLLPLFAEDKEGQLLPIDQKTRFGKGARVVWLVHTERREQAAEWLTSHGWQFVPVAEPQPVQ